MAQEPIDVTDSVEFHLNDGECLPLTKCVCGKRFAPWDFILGVDEDYAHTCPKCGRRLFFGGTIKVYEIVD